NDFIYLVDARKRTESRLVWHGTSWMAVYGNPQDSHPHPCFSEDESKVFYTSDLFGRPAVFMAELEQ
ncbi:MAG: oligogalacturonate lyase family protein, partial [Lachnospiraceae bacterium]|nr:oligogalacturonate lyase family protein [Lachnospiraceae bacterium]